MNLHTHGVFIVLAFIAARSNGAQTCLFNAPLTCSNGTCVEDATGHSYQCANTCSQLHSLGYCLNGATLICNDTQFENATCACYASTRGIRCQHGTCMTDTCYHNATCSVLSEDYAYGKSVFTAIQCQCSSWYRGKFCENLAFPCTNHSCPWIYQKCVQVESPPGYKCVADHCQRIPTCKHGGTCVQLADGYNCTCVIGYQGKNCADETKCTQNDNCMNGGSCNTSSQICTCPHGFKGRFCEINIDDCLGITCSLNGTCLDGVNNYTCNCAPGYTGTHCTEQINECASSPCLRGLCVANLINQYLCICPVDYTGSQCETKRLYCTPESCKNGGNCSKSGRPESPCDCPVHTIGRYCETAVNRSECNSCYINGTRNCTFTGSHFVCDCNPGYSGKKCDGDIKECDTFPCKTGVCIELFGSFRCVCKIGYTGNLCGQEINECDSKPCAVTGSCEDGDGQYICRCLPGYEGTDCSLETDECLSDPCMNGGNCTNAAGYYLCTCVRGFEGQNCEINVGQIVEKNDAWIVNLSGSLTCALMIGYVSKISRFLVM